MDDATHVAAVDAHAESYRRRHHIDFLGRKCILCSPPFFCLHAGMIESSAQPVGLQPLRHGFGVLAADAVDDRRFARMAPQHLQRLHLRIDTRNDAIRQVGTVERADEHRRVMQTQLLGDVRAHPRGCRCGIRVHAGLREAGLELGELAVFRPEVVTPVADAMGFIDGECAHLQPLDELQEARSQQALRRNEYQAIAAGRDLRLGLTEGIERHTAIKGSRRIARFTEPIDLIFHQRDQRRDHDVGPPRQLRRDLIAKRLTASGGHDDQRVASLEAGPNRLLLERAEL